MLMEEKKYGNTWKVKFQSKKRQMIMQIKLTKYLGGGGTRYSRLYGKAPPERDAFSRLYM